MKKIPTIIPISDLRQDAASVVRKVVESSEPYVITQRGRAAAVLQSLASYERTENEIAILRLLAIGQKEIDAGKGTALTGVFSEADDLLGQHE
jgi:prevent-host-death family protein